MVTVMAVMVTVMVTVMACLPLLSAVAIGCWNKGSLGAFAEGCGGAKSAVLIRAGDSPAFRGSHRNTRRLCFVEIVFFIIINSTVSDLVWMSCP